MSEQNHRSSQHRAVIVEVRCWREEIDEVLAPLIQLIWTAGIETMMSCQEVDPGIAWIEFPAVEELLRFLNLVTRYEPGVDTLYNRVNYQLTGPTSEPEWSYQLNLMDIFDGEVEQKIDGLACFEATAGVYFPVTDIPVLVERLQRSHASQAASNTKTAPLAPTATLSRYHRTARSAHRLKQ